MRNLYSALAAVACIVAIALPLLGQPRWMTIPALVIAAVFLGLALSLNRTPREPLTAESLSKDRVAELQRLLDQGQFGTAVKQVQLWYRGTTHDEASAVVHDVAAGAPHSDK